MLLRLLCCLFLQKSLIVSCLTVSLTTRFLGYVLTLTLVIVTHTHRLYESLGEDLPGLGLQGRGLGEPALVHHLALPVTLHLVRVTSETFRLVRA